MILDDFIVIDDVISKTYQDELEDFILNRQKWFFEQDITFPNQHLKDLENAGIDVEYRPGWSTMIYDPNANFGSINNLVTPVLYSAVSLANLKLNNISMIRGFMSAPASKYVTQLIDKPHVDRTEHHYVCLYYVNDSDGDTILFNKRANGHSEIEIKKDIDPKELEVLTTVTPKKGRCVLFDGNRYHSSTQPTKNIRTVINFNYT
jgi:hypothetical protein